MTRIEPNRPMTPTVANSASLPSPSLGAKDAFAQFLDPSEDRSEDSYPESNGTPADAELRPADSKDFETKPTRTGTKADLQALVHKLVDSFRVGQNRVGATEVRMELKNTVFDGMQIRLSQSTDGLRAILSVERYAAKGALEGQVAELTKRLESQGIEVAEIEVQLAPNPGQPHPEDSQGDPASPEWSSGEQSFDSGQNPISVPGVSRNSAASRSIQTATDYSL